MAPLADWVVTWKLVHDTRKNFLNRAGNVARCGGVIQSTDEPRALVHTRATGITVVNDLLESSRIPAIDEISVETVTSWVAISKNEWLLSLTGGPTILELGGVPVYLIEHVWNVLPASGAFAIRWVIHVLLVVLHALGRVIARWKVDIGAERGSITITVPVWKTNAGSSIAWVLNTDAVKPVGVSGVQWSSFVGSRAGPLNRLNTAIGMVDDLLSTGGRRGAEGRVACKDTEPLGEGLDLVGGGIKAVQD